MIWLKVAFSDFLAFKIFLFRVSSLKLLFYRQSSLFLVIFFFLSRWCGEVSIEIRTCWCHVNGRLNQRL